MKTIKHTPGPCFMVKHPMMDGFTATIYLQENNKRIAEVRGDNYALVFAAAPELLSALKTYHEFLTTNFKREELVNYHGESWLAEAEKAIAKAEGGAL